MAEGVHVSQEEEPEDAAFPMPGESQECMLEEAAPCGTAGDPQAMDPQSLSPQRTQRAIATSQGAQSTPEDDIPATQPAGHSPVAASRRLNFEVRLHEAEESAPRPDPLRPLFASLRAARSLDDLSALLEPEDLFANAANATELRRTLFAALEATVDQRDRSVADIGQDPRFELHLLLPTPMWQAVRTVAKQQGWSGEALCQGLVANVGWLHSEGARIRISAEEQHQRTPWIPAFFAAPPSSRKSSLHGYITNKLLQGDRIPEHARPKQSFCNTGTLRGHRNNLYNFGRTGLASSEITETYKVKQESDGVPASQFAQKSHINKWCHSEADYNITGTLRDQNDVYAFYHVVHGQVGPTLEVLTSGNASDIGFLKRFNVVFTDSIPVECPQQQADVSEKLLKDFMEWLGEHNMSQERSDAIEAICLNQFARHWVRVVLEVIREFRDQKEDMSSAWTQKLMYADTDILRWANAVNKMRAFLASKTHLADVVNPFVGTVDVIDVQYALHAWLRQLEYFSALVEHAEQSRRAGSSGSSGPPPQPPSDQDDVLKIMKWVIVDTPDNVNPVTTSILRKMFRHKLAALGGWKRKSKRGAEEAEGADPVAAECAERKRHVGLLLDAVRKLKGVGLVEWADASSGDSARQAGGGHKVLTFKKRLWSDILPNETAISWAKKLKVSQDQFPQVAG